MAYDPHMGPADVLKGLGAGLLHRGNLDPVDHRAAPHVQHEQERIAELGYVFRHLSLRDVCAEILRALQFEDVPRGGRAIGPTEVHRAMSTGIATNIFTTVVSAQLMQAYQESGDSTEGWVSVRDVPDFKTNTRVRLDSPAALDRLPRGGEAHTIVLSDSAETYKAARYAGQFSIDEQDILDDSMEALLTMPRAMGMSAARLRPDLVYSILLANAALGADGVALFDAAGHGNLGSGSGALTAATLQTGITAMASQKLGDTGLNIAAAYLLVPAALRFTAEILLTSAERIVAADSGGTFNPLRSLGIQLRFDERLGVGGIVDPITKTAYPGSATAWYLAANPSQAPTIEVGYVQSTGRRPVVRGYQLTRGQFGLGWDVHLDIGAKALDYRGLYKSTGA